MYVMNSLTSQKALSKAILDNFSNLHKGKSLPKQ